MGGVIFVGKHESLLESGKASWKVQTWIYDSVVCRVRKHLPANYQGALFIALSEEEKRGWPYLRLDELPAADFRLFRECLGKVYGEICRVPPSDLAPKHCSWLVEQIMALMAIVDRDSRMSEQKRMV